MTEQQSVPSRKLSRTESHDLSMIIKDRTKVLKAHAEEQKAVHMADFEKKLAAEYSWDQDEIWKQAVLEAQKIVGEAQERIAKRCVDLGIPASFAPSLGLVWQGRGQNLLAQRRAELRQVAKTTIEAMYKAAITRIEKQSLDLRTQVVSLGTMSDNARLFLESLAPVDDAMTNLEFSEIERRLDDQKTKRISNRMYGEDQF